eukprot:4079114-Lingulodinium_polyedra.AAC.1
MDNNAMRAVLQYISDLRAGKAAETFGYIPDDKGHRLQTVADEPQGADDSSCSSIPCPQLLSGWQRRSGQ